MICKYCSKGRNIIDALVEDKARIGAFVWGDRLAMWASTSEGVFKKTAKINYCPMCGEKIGDANE